MEMSSEMHVLYSDRERKLSKAKLPHFPFFTWLKEKWFTVDIK